MNYIEEALDYNIYMEMLIEEYIMVNIIKRGISSNMLKTIALIAMVIDHIGFYFEPFFNVDLWATAPFSV